MNDRPRFPVSVVLGFLLVFAALPAGAVNLHPGEPAPEFSLPDIDGHVVTLKELRDKTVLIVFWSTWCSRCADELTFLRDTFGKRPDVTVLLVNQDSEKMVPRERIAELRDRLSLSFPIIVDSGLMLWDKFGINALPTSVVVGKDGRVVYAEPNFYSESPTRILDAVPPP